MQTGAAADAPQGPATGYVSGIDGLRAIAVLSVIAYHLNRDLLPGGFTGVDVFFVISGYVISKSLAASPTDRLGAYILDFYKRRVLRILPALVAMVLVVGVLSTLFIPQAWLSRPNNSTALTALFGVSNINLVWVIDGYFSERVAFNPFVHTWSLGVEEQFYIFFPLIFYFWRQAGDAPSGRRRLAQGLLPAVALASLALAAYQTTAKPEWAFYMLPSRFWELAAGALLFQSQRGWAMGGDSVPSGVRSNAALALGLLLVAVGMAWGDEHAFPFPWALAPVLGSVLMIAGVTGGGAGQALLGSRWLTYVGRLSYSLYLWHWPVFTLFRWTVGLERWGCGLAALVLTAALAAVSYHTVETAFRRHKLFAGQPSAKVVARGVVVMVAAMACLGLFFRYADRLHARLSVTSRNLVDWESDYSGIPGREAPVAVGVDANTPGFGRHLWVLGDSHAGAYNRMLKWSVASLGAQVSTFTRPGCPIGDLLLPIAHAPWQCHDTGEEALAWLRQGARKGDIVFLASLRVHRLGDQFRGFDMAQQLARSASPAEVAERQLALAETAQWVQKVQAMGLVVLMDAPKPVFPSPAFRCADWFDRSNPICRPGFRMARETLLKHREPVMASLHELQQTQGVRLWDPFPLLCHEAVCAAFDADGKPLFKDGDHLSGHGNQVLVPSFTEQLRQIWGGVARDGL